jgi:hypothetical protein
MQQQKKPSMSRTSLDFFMDVMTTAGSLQSQASGTLPFPTPNVDGAATFFLPFFYSQ